MRYPLHVATWVLSSLCAGGCGARVGLPIEEGKADAGAHGVGVPSADGGRTDSGSIPSADAHGTPTEAGGAMPDGSDSGDARSISSADAHGTPTEAGEAGDAMPDGSDSGDAPSAACDETSGFGAPIAIPDLSSAGRDDGLSLSPDELTAYLSSGRLSSTGVDQIFVASKAAAAHPFGAATLLAGIGASAPGESDYEPRISTDGQRLYFSSYQNAESHIYVASRADVAGQFGGSQLVPGVNSSSATNDKDEYLTPDEANLYFSSNRLGSQSLFWATRSSAGTFAEPTQVAELMASPPANDHSPVVTADQLTIFFASDRSGNMDIWTATRASTGSPFGAPVEATALNTGAVDYPQWISSDGCTLYLAEGTYDALHFYKATRGH